MAKQEKELLVSRVSNKSARETETYRLTNGFHQLIIHFFNTLFDEKGEEVLRSGSPCIQALRVVLIILPQEELVLNKNLRHQGRINSSWVPRTVVNDLQFES